MLLPRGDRSNVIYHLTFNNIQFGFELNTHAQIFEW